MTDPLKFGWLSSSFSSFHQFEVNLVPFYFFLHGFYFFYINKIKCYLLFGVSHIKLLTEIWNFVKMKVIGKMGRNYQPCRAIEDYPIQLNQLWTKLIMPRYWHVVTTKMFPSLWVSSKIKFHLSKSRTVNFNLVSAVKLINNLSCNYLRCWITWLSVPHKYCQLYCWSP